MNIKPNMLAEMVINGHSESVSLTLALIQVLVKKKLLTLDDHAEILSVQKPIMEKMQALNRGEDPGSKPAIFLPPQNGRSQ